MPGLDLGILLSTVDIGAMPGMAEKYCSEVGVDQAAVDPVDVDPLARPELGRHVLDPRLGGGFAGAEVGVRRVRPGAAVAGQHDDAAPINFRFSPGETAFVLDDSRPVAYIYDGAIADIARDALVLARHPVGTIVTVDSDSPNRPHGVPVPAAIPFGSLLTADRPASYRSRRPARNASPGAGYGGCRWRGRGLLIRP